MSFDFPASPADGTIYVPPGGPQYQYSGGAWRVASSSVPIATAEARNRIVNGAMQVSQENGRSSVAVNGAYPADQWAYGFSAVSSSSASAASTPNYIRLWSASVLTTPVTNFTATQQWQEFVMPMPGPTAGTWPVDNTASVTVAFTCMAGPTFIAPAAGGWQAGNFLAAPGVGNLFTAVSQGLDIADVGLHLDPLNTGIALPWTMPDEIQELAACQRYYLRSTIVVGTDMANGANQAQWPIGAMRIAPAESWISGPSGGSIGAVDNTLLRALGNASAFNIHTLASSARM
jgi:hypothetical protein